MTPGHFSCTYTPSHHHGGVGFCLDVSLPLLLPGSACVVETTCLLVFKTPTLFIVQISVLVYLFSLVLDFLQNRCPNGWVSRTTSSRQPLEKVYRLLKHSIVGLLKSVRQRLHHPPKSSYLDLPLTERSGTDPSGSYHGVVEDTLCQRHLPGVNVRGDADVLHPVDRLPPPRRFLLVPRPQGRC